MVLSCCCRRFWREAEKQSVPLWLSGGQGRCARRRTGFDSVQQSQQFGSGQRMMRLSPHHHPASEKSDITHHPPSLHRQEPAVQRRTSTHRSVKPWSGVSNEEIARESSAGLSCHQTEMMDAVHNTTATSHLMSLTLGTGSMELLLGYPETHLGSIFWEHHRRKDTWGLGARALLAFAF